jgi:hypothetical protein
MQVETWTEVERDGQRVLEKKKVSIHSTLSRTACQPLAFGKVRIWRPPRLLLFPFMHVMQATGLGQGQQLPNAAGSLALLSADRLTEIEHLPPCALPGGEL